MVSSGEVASTLSLCRAEGAIPDVENGNQPTTTVETAPEQPQMSVAVCIGLLIVVTVVRASCDCIGNFSRSSLVGRCHCGIPRRLD
jgi:hypothetical protein